MSSCNPFRDRAEGVELDPAPWSAQMDPAPTPGQQQQDADTDERVDRLLQSLVALGQVVKELAGRVEQIEGRLTDG